MTRRFGTIFPFLESGRRAGHLGRLVANHEFARALLRHGTYDEYVFSNPSISNLNLFSETLEEWRIPEARRAAVTCVSYTQLPEVLRTRAFHVFHLGGWGWFMPGLHHIRAAHASNPWPITAVTHSLNGRDVIDHAVRLSRAAMAPYDAIFCTSRDGLEAQRRLVDGGAAIAGRRYAGRLEHLPLGIDDDLIDQPGDRARTRARLRIDADAVVLLVLGRITPFQKMDLGPLLRTFAQQIVPKSPRPVCLLLAGGATTDDLIRVKALIARYRIDAHVRLHANFPAEKKGDVLAAADLLVSPVDNTQETFGLSLLEAMAAGVPVVASRFDGYKDLVEDGVDGYLVDTYGAPADPMDEWFDVLDPTIAQLFQSQGVAVDLAQLADRLLRLIGDEPLRKTMATAGRVKVARDYRWSRIIARYEETWDRLSAEAAATGLVRPYDASNLYNLGPRAIFPHYPSHTIDAGVRLVATTETLDEGPYNETSPILSRPLLTALLAQAKAPTDVQDLTSKVDAPNAHATYAITWLLKYGMLKMADSELRT